MYNQLLYEVWKQDKRKGLTKMTNFDKVKEMMDIEEVANYYNLLCKTIYKLQGKEYCYCDCAKCYEWLKQEYKESPKPILTYKEKQYLSSVINPFRDKVINITKLINDDDLEFIEIGLNNNTYAMLPAFAKDTMYKNMVYGKEYTLEELDL